MIGNEWESWPLSPQSYLVSGFRDGVMQKPWYVTVGGNREQAPVRWFSSYEEQNAFSTRLLAAIVAVKQAAAVASDAP